MVAMRSPRKKFPRLNEETFRQKLLYRDLDCFNCFASKLRDERLDVISLYVGYRQIYTKNLKEVNQVKMAVICEGRTLHYYL